MAMENMFKKLQSAIDDSMVEISPSDAAELKRKAEAERKAVEAIKDDALVSATRPAIPGSCEESWYVAVITVISCQLAQSMLLDPGTVRKLFIVVVTTIIRMVTS
jgi:hypothetical protein